MSEALEGIGFGKWLRYQLWQREMNQAELARRGGFTPSMVSFWARDERAPDPESCNRIAEVLGLDVDEVLTRAGHRPADYDETSEAMRNVMALMHRLGPDDQRHIESYARWYLVEVQNRHRRRELGPPDVTASVGA